MSEKYKVLTNEDVEQLSKEMSSEELKEADDGVYRLNKCSTDEKRPCCNSCGCTGYRNGIPSTICRICGHSWRVHNC